MIRNLPVSGLLVILGASASLGILGCAESPRVDPTHAIIEATSVLRNAAEDADPVVRANALEAMAATLGTQVGANYIQALSDPSAAVRFAAAMAIGDTRYAPARAQLDKMAQDKTGEPDRRVFVAVVYALFRLGDETYLNQLARSIRDPEKEVRADAAMILGKMDDPSAVEPLKMALKDERDPGAQIQFVEALARLGDVRSIYRLEAYTKTTYVDERLVAIRAISEVNPPRAEQILDFLLGVKQPIPVRVAAVGALARLGLPYHGGDALCAEAIKNPEGLLRAYYGKDREIKPVEIVSLQELAAISLGWMRQEPAVEVLVPLLQSHDGTVRVAAAMSILRLLSLQQEALAAQEAARTAKAQQKPAETSKPVTPRLKLKTAGAKD